MRDHALFAEHRAGEEPEEPEEPEWLRDAGVILTASTGAASTDVYDTIRSEFNEIDKILAGMRDDVDQFNSLVSDLAGFLQNRDASMLGMMTQLKDSARQLHSNLAKMGEPLKLHNWALQDTMRNAQEAKGDSTSGHPDTP